MATGFMWAVSTCATAIACGPRTAPVNRKANQSARNVGTTWQRASGRWLKSLGTADKARYVNRVPLARAPEAAIEAG